MRNIPSVFLRPPVLLLTFVAVVGLSSVLGITRATELSVIRLDAGQAAEVGTDAHSPNAQYSWILTKDRKFVAAQRTKFFQMRLKEPGTYVLDVSVQDPSSSESDYHAFTIIVSEQLAPLQRTADSGALAAVLHTIPPAMDGTVYLPPEGGVLGIDATSSRGNISSYALDLDTGTDTDGDGNPDNDRDNAGTMSEREGTPLYLFMEPHSTPRSITLTVTDLSNPQPSSISLPILFAPPPATTVSSAQTQPSVTTGPMGIQVHGLAIQCTPILDQTSAQGNQLLYEWDFGDHVRSLLKNPSHTYAVDGAYTVSLTVTDIATGTTVSSGSMTVSVTAALKEGSASSSARTEPVITQQSSVPTGTTSPPQGQSSTAKSVAVGTIIMVGLVILCLLGLIVVGFLVVRIVKRKASATLQKTLESMEKTIVGRDTKPPVAASHQQETLKLKKESAPVKRPSDIADRETSTTEFASNTRTNETPLATAGPVPSWLKNTGTKPSTPPAASVTPPSPTPPSKGSTPSWLTSATTTATQAPVPVPSKDAPPPSASAPAAAPTPSWLTNTATKPTTTPAPALAPQTPAPAPQAVSPAAPPASAPSWLTQSPKPAPAPSAPSVTPAPSATPPAPSASAPDVPLWLAKAQNSAPVQPATTRASQPTASAPPPSVPAANTQPKTSPVPLNTVIPIAPPKSPLPPPPVAVAPTPTATPSPKPAPIPSKPPAVPTMNNTTKTPPAAKPPTSPSSAPTSAPLPTNAVKKAIPPSSPPPPKLATPVAKQQPPPPPIGKTPTPTPTPTSSFAPRSRSGTTEDKPTPTLPPAAPMPISAAKNQNTQKTSDNEPPIAIVQADSLSK